MLESFHARLATPFAVLGIRTVGGRLTDIEYLPRGAAELAPLNPLAERVCRQLERYVDDPAFRFDLPFIVIFPRFLVLIARPAPSSPNGLCRP